ncbi:carboxypeptidase regulatory-like domain-containing protein [Runella sp. SP2]|nr:carboxypeptidase regulatory-like domain-containing protein [Runella sp. SP2]
MNMKPLTKPWLYAAGIILLAQSCSFDPNINRQATISGTVIDNVTQLPVPNVEIMVYGQKGVWSSVSGDLKTVYTDSTGKYNIVIVLPKEFHSFKLINNYNSDPNVALKYRGCHTYLNGQQTQNCCKVEMGSKAQYDFRMIPK